MHIADEVCRCVPLGPIGAGTGAEAGGPVKVSTEMLKADCCI